MEEKFNQVDAKDLIMACGDFNQNSSKEDMTELQQQYLRELEMTYAYQNILPLLTDEYAALLNALKSPLWSIIDCVRMSQNGG